MDHFPTLRFTGTLPVKQVLPDVRKGNWTGVQLKCEDGSELAVEVSGPGLPPSGYEGWSLKVVPWPESETDPTNERPCEPLAEKKNKTHDPSKYIAKVVVPPDGNTTTFDYDCSFGPPQLVSDIHAGTGYCLRFPLGAHAVNPSSPWGVAGGGMACGWRLVARVEDKNGARVFPEEVCATSNRTEVLTHRSKQGASAPSALHGDIVLDCNLLSRVASCTLGKLWDLVASLEMGASATTVGIARRFLKTAESEADFKTQFVKLIGTPAFNALQKCGLGDVDKLVCPMGAGNWALHFEKHLEQHFNKTTKAHEPQLKVQCKRKPKAGQKAQQAAADGEDQDGTASQAARTARTKKGAAALNAAADWTSHAAEAIFPDAPQAAVAGWHTVPGSLMLATSGDAICSEGGQFVASTSEPAGGSDMTVALRPRPYCCDGCGIWVTGGPCPFCTYGGCSRMDGGPHPSYDDDSGACLDSSDGFSGIAGSDGLGGSPCPMPASDGFGGKAYLMAGYGGCPYPVAGSAGLGGSPSRALGIDDFIVPASPYRVPESGGFGGSNEGGDSVAEAARHIPVPEEAGSAAGRKRKRASKARPHGHCLEAPKCARTSEEAQEAAGSRLRQCAQHARQSRT